MVNGQTVSLGLLGSQPRDVAFTVNPSAPVKVFAVTDEVAGGVVRSMHDPVAESTTGLSADVPRRGRVGLEPDARPDWEWRVGRVEGTHDESSPRSCRETTWLDERKALLDRRRRR